jgi:phosphoribosylamine---glycine ligase
MTSPQRILIVGGGAREHALAWRLAAEDEVREVHVAPGNAGMADVASVHLEVGANDLSPVAGLAREIAPDLVVVGPEAPLAAGLADLLNDDGFATFGPSRAAARLESSKSFCREVAAAAGIPMADGASFEVTAEAIDFARSLAGPVVVKADGLAAGKGVALCASASEAESAIRAALDDGAFGQAGRRVVVERQLTGREASVMAICDGSTALALPAARDHKRAYDDDLGPNTGGMGAYSPLDDLPDDEAERLIELFHRPALAEMVRRGTPFRGLLYAGLMLTPDGSRLLEFNVRFGDPEAQAVLPRIDGQLAPVLLAAALGSLDGVRLKIGNEATVAVVLAANGYPANPRTGDEIDGIADARASGALVFHGGTAQVDGRSVTNGGRVLTVVGRGADVSGAREQAYEAAGRIRFAGMHYRRDIGAVGVPLLAGAVR